MQRQPKIRKHVPVWRKADRTSRIYRVASYAQGTPGEAEGLETYAQLLGGDQTSLLYRVLDNLPGDVRFRIEEMEFTPTLVTLRGQVPSHASVDSIVTSLGHVSDLIVENPQTRELNGGEVEFIDLPRRRVDAQRRIEAAQRGLDWSEVDERVD